MRQARDRLDSIKVKKNYETGIWLPGSRSDCNLLFRLAAGSLLLGEERRLCFPEIVMRPGDRIALTGPNGSGKSTLIGHIMGLLGGSGIRVTYLPQEIDVGTSRKLMDEVRNLSNEEKGHMMTIVSRLGSRPHRLLESCEPSPGEVRKLLLAMGILHEPNLIVMDEPTNHLDLPSIRCLEEALSDCPCGLLLVSHDRVFLDALTRIGWHIDKRDKNENGYKLSIF
jgi:ATPase subunit of ABC transporter with duplicated ATPase domains